MKIQKAFTVFILLLSSLTLTACGQNHQETAEVTLITGLESSSKPINLMEKINTLSSGVSPTCVQDQIYAGYQIASANGGSDRIATYPVSLTTPNVNSNQLSTYANGVSGWLASSTLGTIKLPAPVGVPLEFGILGSLATSDGNTNPDGTCAMMSSATTPFPTYSLIGRARATVLGKTDITIKLWVTDAQPSAITAYPSPAPAGSTCAPVDDGGGNLSQQCANLNFRKINILCRAGTSCSAITLSFLELEYFYGINRVNHVHQRVNFLSAGPESSGAHLGIMIPQVDPLKISLYDGVGALQETLIYNPPHGSTPSDEPVPNFVKPTGEIDADAFAFVREGSGVTPPQSFSINQVQQTTTGIKVDWRKSHFADSYSLSSRVSGTVASTVLSVAQTAPTTFLLLSNALTPGTPYTLSMTATTNGVSIPAGNEISITPVAQAPNNTYAPTVAQVSSGSVSVSLSSSQANAFTGATTFFVRYGPSSEVTSGILSTYSQSMNLPASGASYSTVITGLVPGKSYTFLVQAVNNNQGSAITADTVQTAPL